VRCTITTRTHQLRNPIIEGSTYHSLRQDWPGERIREEAVVARVEGDEQDFERSVRRSGFYDDLRNGEVMRAVFATERAAKLACVVDQAPANHKSQENVNWDRGLVNKAGRYSRDRRRTTSRAPEP
jgi:hypothetical protein